MASTNLQQVPGFNGYIAKRYSSMDRRVIGKFTDANHLESLTHGLQPTEYDKKIITLYTQTSLYANDFMQMLDKSTPFYLNSNSDYWQWKVEVPYKFNTIVEIPSSTSSLSVIGIDSQEFQLVFERKFNINEVITCHKMYGQRFVIIDDPTPYNTGWLHTLTLISPTPLTDFVNPRFIAVGIEYQVVDVLVGEFDSKLAGLDNLADSIMLYETLSAGYGVQHSITGWADARTLRDSNGKPLDIMVYAKQRRNEAGKAETVDVRWEPFVETLCRKKMMDLKVNRMIWGTPGLAKTRGSKQELKQAVSGLYYQMRQNGNLVRYNKGQFSINLLRDVFGDLFYRRVDMGERRVDIFTNEAGFDVFDQACKQDAMGSGVSFMSHGNDGFIQNKGMDGQINTLQMNFAFNSIVTRETGTIKVHHLRELDLPQTNTEFGQNKKSTPIFMVFDVSPSADGSLINNIREVRHAGAPSMTWGYVDGTVSHLGFAKSQGMQSASMDPWYTMWFKDRADIFVEDLSRTVLIEEIPQF